MASSEDQVVRLAVARGWLAQHQVEGALRSAASQGLTLAQLLARHRPDAAQELSVLARAAPVAQTLAPPIPATLAVQPPQTHAAARSGAMLVPRPEEPGRARVVAALREALGRDPRFAPHLDLVLERRGVLGEGGMGVVHRVLDKRLGRLAALKVMKSEHADPQDVARFFREAELTARLDHPSVPPVYEAGTDAAGRPYLLMRLIEGQPLSERIAALHRGGRPPPLAEVRELVEVLVKVGEAVARAHARGMVHRDLKPGNVMVGAHGEVLVLDWGLVRVLDGPDDDALLRAGNAAPTSAELTQAGALLGTPGYMSPEQAGGEPVDARADVFALGAILCAILTSAPPVSGTSVLNVVANTVQGQIARPRDRWRGCPRELDSICAAALAFDRAGRTPSADAFVADLRAYLAGADVPSHRYGALERVGRAMRRRPAVLVALAALAVVTGVSAAAASRVRSARAEVAQREAFQGAMRLLIDAEAAAGRRSDETAGIVSRALALGGDAVRWNAARVLDLAGRPEEAARVLEPTIDEAARPPPLQALLFLHLLQLHAAPEAERGRSRTPALERLLRLAPAAPAADELRAFAEGTLALDRKELALAEQRLSDALVRSPSLPWALVNRAEVRRLARDLAGCARDLDAAVEAGRGDPAVVVLALLQRASLHLQRARMGAAVADAERAVALAPASRIARLTASLALASSGRGAEAEAVLAPLLGGPLDVELLLARSRARLTQGDVVPGRADLDAALAIDARDPRLLADRTQILLVFGAPAEAQESAAALIRAAPDDARSHLLAAAAAVEAGALDVARGHCDRAVELDRAPQSLRLRGEVAVASGDLAAATRDVEAAIALDREDPASLLSLASLRAALKDPAGALAAYDAALALVPDDQQTRQARAALRFKQRDLWGALDDYDRLVASQPRRAEVRAVRARLAVELGDLVCAERDARLALDLDPAPYQLVTSGLVARAQGQPEAAAALARRALDADPGSVEARMLLDALAGPAAKGADGGELVRQGYASYVKGEYAEAARLATEAIGRAERAEAYVLRARARGMQDDLRGATEDAERALALDPSLPEAWLTRGSMRQARRDHQGALADAEEGLRRRAGDMSLRLLRAQARGALGQVKEALAELDELLATLGPKDPNRPGLQAIRDDIARQR